MGSKHCIDSFEVEFKDLVHARHFFHAGNTAVNKTMKFLVLSFTASRLWANENYKQEKNVNTQNGLVFNK